MVRNSVGCIGGHLPAHADESKERPLVASSLTEVCARRVWQHEAPRLAHNRVQQRCAGLRSGPQVGADPHEHPCSAEHGVVQQARVPVGHELAQRARRNHGLRAQTLLDARRAPLTSATFWYSQGRTCDVAGSMPGWGSVALMIPGLNRVLSQKCWMYMPTLPGQASWTCVTRNSGVSWV